MNMELLTEYIETFKREVIETGFKRDLEDYISSLPSVQGNIIALREIAFNVLAVLDDIYEGDLPDALDELLPSEDVRPFTEFPHNNNLRELVEDAEIQQQDFFNLLSKHLNQLKKQINDNHNELNTINDFISPYISIEEKNITKEHAAIISVVFKEKTTITSLKHFTKTLNAWNKILPIYHQLITSESPEDIEIVEVQNGSIDLVINLNLDVAMDLVELFKLGFEVFGAYLSYKTMIKPIIDSYHGNKKLISQEEEREKLLLENIGSAIHRKIEEQHKKAKKLDRNIDGTAISKKIEQVTNLVSSHIINGNDLKLLAVPDQSEEEPMLSKKKYELLEQSTTARRQLRQINSEAQQLLLETYGQLKDSQD